MISGEYLWRYLFEFDVVRLIDRSNIIVVRYFGNATKLIEVDQKPSGQSDTVNFRLRYVEKLADVLRFCHWCGVSAVPVVETTITYPGPAYDAGRNHSNNQ